MEVQARTKRNREKARSFFRDEHAVCLYEKWFFSLFFVLYHIFQIKKEQVYTSFGMIALLKFHIHLVVFFIPNLYSSSQFPS